MLAHQHCDLFHPVGWRSAWVYHTLGNAPVLRSRTGSWVLTGQSGVRHPLSPVIRLGLWNPRKKERKSVEIPLQEGRSKSQTILLPKTSNPFREWHRGVQIFLWLSFLARRVLAIPTTSTSPERFFPAVCHVIILKDACIYMRPGLKSVSGPQTRRSLTWINSSLWPLFFLLTFCLRRGVLL